MHVCASLLGKVSNVGIQVGIVYRFDPAGLIIPG